MTDSLPEPQQPPLDDPLEESDQQADADPDTLAESFDALLDTIRNRVQWLRDHPTYSDEVNRPGAYMLMIHMLISHLEEDLLFDPDFPTFRVVDQRTRGGGDNSDQRYLMARINGGDTYRIWGRIGAERRVELQVYAGNPYVAGGGGRSAGFLAHEDLQADPGGRFEVIASPTPPALPVSGESLSQETPATGESPEPPELPLRESGDSSETPAAGESLLSETPAAGESLSPESLVAGESPGSGSSNWIENPPDGTRILVRQVYSEWSRDDMGEIHIDRVGHEGDLKPLLTADELAARLRRATAGFDNHVGLWPEMVRRLYMERLQPNELSAPIDPGAVGGVSGRFMAFGIWDLADDEALVVTTWPASGNYQGIQLTDLWWSSLEYANRQTSLTGDQALLGDDGNYTFVLAASDPGVANWLDTMGMRRGVIMLRFDGTREPEFDPAKRPVVRLVKFSDLDRHLGPGVARLSAEDRRAAIAARRAHVQVRFGT